MAAPSYLAFDLGASSSRGVLGTLEGDVLRLDEVHRFPTPIIDTGDFLFWDLDVIWDELQAGLRKAREVAPDLRAKLQPLSDYKLMTTCVGLDSNGDPSDPDVAMRHVLCSLAGRWLDLHEEIKAHTKRLKKLTTATAPRLVDAFGIGPDIAGELLVAAGDNTNRIRSEAAFAKLCGVCPIPAGSGKTSGRLRLNRGGNRQANAALYRAVIVRMRWHTPTISYVERRTGESLSPACDL